MIKDLEGHEVHIAQEGNGHILVYGNSGQGKTFFLCRLLEEYVERGEKVLIVDFSGSYSDVQLREKNFVYMDQIRRNNLIETELFWHYRLRETDRMCDDIVDALSQVIGCNGYFQIKILHDVVNHVAKKGDVSLASIVNELENTIQEDNEQGENAGYMDAAGKLLTRLYPCRIENLHIKRGKMDATQIKPISIIDLTGFAERQRNFLTEFIVNLFWREIYRQEFENRCNVLLLDEVQFMSMKKGSTLPALLREARKRDVKIILSTQFISCYEREELLALQQVDNTVIFRPAPEDYRWSAKRISLENYKEWEKKLAQLRRGEAVLKGFYRLDERKKVSMVPIIINI